MGAEGAAKFILRREIKDAEDSNAKRQKKLQNTERIFPFPYQAAKSGMLIESSSARISPTLILHLGW
jgi:acetyl-CoA carboxylase carboxyltransferase component